MSSLRRFVPCVVTVTTLIALAAGCSDSSSGASGTPTTAGPAATASGIPGVVFERAPSRNHINGHADYHGAKPPTGGDHNPVPAPCRYYDQQIPDENGVHSLEHGAVWIAFAPSPATSATDINAIKGLVSGHAKVLASPYADLKTPVVLVAWEHRLELDSIDDPRAAQFIATYAGGTTAPEPNASC